MSKHTHMTDIVKQFGIHEGTSVPNEDGTILIQSGTKKFVLHQSRMDKERIKRWETVFRVANDKQVRSILPVYPTLEGKLHVKDKRGIFYLTPYIEEKESSNPVDLMSEVGDIHEKTKHTFLIEKNPLFETYSTYKTKIQTKQKDLRQMMDVFEQQRYMSPLALQVCSHFHVVDDAIIKGIEHVDAIIHMCKENDDAHMEWSSSLCHNRLSMNSLVKNYHIYVKNWEGVTFDNGTSDLVHFFNNEFLRNEFPLDSFVNGLHAYEKNYSMSSIEKHMLIVHLLHPVHYIDMVASIRKMDQKSSYLQHVITLERLFRIISSSLYMMSTYDQPVHLD